MGMSSRDKEKDRITGALNKADCCVAEILRL